MRYLALVIACSLSCKSPCDELVKTLCDFSLTAAAQDPDASLAKAQANCRDFEATLSGVPSKRRGDLAPICKSLNDSLGAKRTAPGEPMGRERLETHLRAWISFKAKANEVSTGQAGAAGSGLPQAKESTVTAQPTSVANDSPGTLREYAARFQAREDARTFDRPPPPSCVPPKEITREDARKFGVVGSAVFSTFQRGEFGVSVQAMADFQKRPFLASLYLSTTHLANGLFAANRAGRLQPAPSNEDIVRQAFLTIGANAAKLTDQGLPSFERARCEYTRDDNGCGGTRLEACSRFQGGKLHLCQAVPGGRCTSIPLLP